MKDIVITRKALRRELFILLGCFVFAVGVNTFAILKSARPAKELVTMIGYVIVVAGIVYLLLGVVRLIAAWVVHMLRAARHTDRDLPETGPETGTPAP